MIDFAGLLDSPAYAQLGISAEITPVGGKTVTLTVLEGTAEVEEPGAGGVVIPSVQPAADLRLSELAEKGLTRADLVKAEVGLGGVLYRVLGTQPLSNRRELRLVLTEIEC